MSTVAEDYRLALEAQNARFDNRPGAGSVDHSMTDTDEYRAYFGQGEWNGAGVETRLTFKQYLTCRAAEARAELAAAEQPAPKPEPVAPSVTDAEPADGPLELVTAEGAFQLSRDDLTALADAGCVNAAAEIARRAAKRAAKRQARRDAALAA